MPKNAIDVDVLRHSRLIEELTQNSPILKNRILTLNADISVSERAIVIHNMSSETPLNTDSETVNIFSLGLILFEIWTFEDNHFLPKTQNCEIFSHKIAKSQQDHHLLLNLYSHQLSH